MKKHALYALIAAAAIFLSFTTSYADSTPSPDDLATAAGTVAATAAIVLLGGSSSPANDKLPPAAPEPTTLLLLSAGGVALAGYRAIKRRGKK